MMTSELADYLIGLEKYIAEGETLREHFEVVISYPMNFNLFLFSPQDHDQSFRVNVWESAKAVFKVSLHHQDDSAQYGLLRVDYNARHKNPEEITEEVPERFHPYAGMYLDEYSGHIHYVLDGYKPLAWALPLEIDGFPVQQIKAREDYPDALNAFFRKINIKTKITFHTQTGIV